MKPARWCRKERIRHRAKPEHYIATQVQRQAGGGTYAAERRIGYKAMRRAGLSQEGARCHMMRAGNYFSGLGVGANTALRVPGNR
jgi:hypothetical protein